MTDRTVDLLNLLERGLDITARRHQYLTNNIANADTPGYKRQDISFSRELEKYLEGDRFAAGTRIAELRHRFLNPSFRNDRNEVDIDVEMAELAKNSIRYKVLSEQLREHLSSIRKAVTGGRF